MSFKPHRSDYTRADTIYTRHPESQRFIKAERTYDFFFPERLGINGKPIRTHGKESFFGEEK